MKPYQRTIEYLYEQLPMFQRIGAAAFKKDLSNIIALCDALGNPQNAFKSIHIAGTNGKGSVAHMLCSVLQKCNMKVGIYTSPHYTDFRERIKINSRKVTQKYVIEFVRSHKKLMEKLRPSFFEITVAMALDYFRQRGVDVAIMETGLGGRLDSTNIITPVLSIITNIDYDHQQFLGDTLAEIAGEKAGIIKEKVPVVIGERHSETDPVFESMAKAKGAPLHWAQSGFKIHLIEYDHSRCYYRVDERLYWNFSYIECDLTGWYQKENIQTTLQSLWILQESGVMRFSEKCILTALKSVKKMSGIKGRWQILGSQPLVVADSAHNTQGIRVVLKQIMGLPAVKRHFVLGFVQDKPVNEILNHFPKEGIYYFTQPDLPRALKAGALADTARQLGLTGAVFLSVSEAVAAAKANASAADLIFIGGSTFVVAEVIL